MRVAFRTLFCGLLCATAATLPAGDAHAQPRKTTAASLAEAKRLFDEGADLYGEGNYEGAIERWEISYELSKKPLIFESIANAYERLGDAKKAREYLEKWRDAAPRDEKALLETRLKNLDTRIAKEEEEEQKRAAEEEKQKAAEARKAAEKRAEKEEEASGTSVPGLVLLGAGASVVAVGVTLDLIASAQRPNEAEACKASGDRQLCLSSEKDSIESSSTLALVGDVMWIAGSVAAAAGLVLVLTYEPDQPERDKTSRVEARVSPWAGPHTGGVSLGGSF